MFTGIITGIGRISNVSPLGGALQNGLSLSLHVPLGYLSDVQLGDSIAINGACMTVTSMGDDSFTVDVSSESLAKTTGLAQAGPVNLEKALRAGDRLGGHIVSGHVDGIGSVESFVDVGDDWKDLRILAPLSLAPFLAYKGSITINGVSLTVNTVEDQPSGCLFSMRLIPHTLQETTLGTLRVGSTVNLEIDTVARYVERMLQTWPAQGKAPPPFEKANP